MSDQSPLRAGEVFEGPARALTDADFEAFAGLTGDRHPIHHDAAYAKGTRFGRPVAHGLLLASLTALGASTGKERCHGFVFVQQDARFLKPAFVGDTLRAQLTVERVWQEKKRHYCRFRTALYNQRGEQLLEGFHVYRIFGAETEKTRS